MTDGSSDKDQDLADKAMAGIDFLVDTVRDKIIRRVLLVGRSIAYGSVIAFAALVLVVAACIGAMRLLDVYAFPGIHEWASFAVLGVLLVAAGLFLWRRRKPVAS